MRPAFPIFLGLSLACSLLGACAAFQTPVETTAEYQRSWGLGAINALPAYQAGASGRGVLVAIVDCGLGDDGELRRNISRRSVDLVQGRAAPMPIEPHADFVAGPLGAARDGRGLLGVAWRARVLSIRADIDGGFNGQCAFRPHDLARAIDYALTQGARVIVLPVQHPRPLVGGFEEALARAVSAGAVVVTAAGNDGQGAPAYPAAYAADPRFERGVVVVGAERHDGDLAAWSNRAGPAALRYISAPGEAVLTDCGRLTCKQVSGTSFAAPYVAGALALVLDARPSLSPQDAADLILAAGRDRGAEGVDLVRGRGGLDVGAAFARLSLDVGARREPLGSGPADRSAHEG